MPDKNSLRMDTDMTRTILANTHLVGSLSGKVFMLNKTYVISCWCGVIFCKSFYCERDCSFAFSFKQIKLIKARFQWLIILSGYIIMTQYISTKLSNIQSCSHTKMKIIDEKKFLIWYLERSKNYLRMIYIL